MPIKHIFFLRDKLSCTDFLSDCLFTVLTIRIWRKRHLLEIFQLYDITFTDTRQWRSESKVLNTNLHKIPQVKKQVLFS